jgi:hypothetical protein
MPLVEYVLIGIKRQEARPEEVGHGHVIQRVIKLHLSMPYIFSGERPHTSKRFFVGSPEGISLKL